MQGKRNAAVVCVCGASLMLVAIAGCPVSTEAPDTNEVFMRALAFVPNEIMIKVGESVTWQNMDIVPHTATSGNPGDAGAGSIFRAPETGLLSGNQSATVTFDEAGEFRYFCEVHPGTMRDAMVIVEAQ